jgi:hypothetical protein
MVGEGDSRGSAPSLGRTWRNAPSRSATGRASQNRPRSRWSTRSDTWTRRSRRTRWAPSRCPRSAIRRTSGMRRPNRPPPAAAPTGAGACLLTPTRADGSPERPSYGRPNAPRTAQAIGSGSRSSRRARARSDDPPRACTGPRPPRIGCTPPPSPHRRRRVSRSRTRVCRHALGQPTGRPQA